MARLDARVRDQFQVSWGKARGWIETGKIRVNGEAATDPGAPVDPEASIELKMNAPRPRAGQGSDGPALSKSDILHVDSQLVVVKKPAGLSTVPYEKGEKGSLEQQISEHLRQKVIVVHRLDRETSGLLVFARTREAGEALANQFRFHTVLRRYLALAVGSIPSQTIRSTLVENRGDGLRGSIGPSSSISKDAGKPAVTHVTAIDPVIYGDGTRLTLVECRLETGRTHQIRIHLSEAGHPLLGEKAYIRDYRGPALPKAPRFMLHAAELGFLHPTRQVPMRWVELPPEDFLGILSEQAKKKLKERF